MFVVCTKPLRPKPDALGPGRAASQGGAIPRASLANGNIVYRGTIYHALRTVDLSGPRITLLVVGSYRGKHPS